MFFVGAGGITMAATANATIQLSVPDGLRGRVMSVYTTVFSASVPIGGLAMGALASAVGIPLTFAIGGLLSLATGLGAFVWWRRIRSGWTGVMPPRAPAADRRLRHPRRAQGRGSLQPSDLPARQLAEVQSGGLVDRHPATRVG